MASLSINGFDEVMKQLERLATKAPDIAEKAVNASMPTLVNSYKSAINGQSSSAGPLAASITSTPAKHNQWGCYGVARPVGTLDSGTRAGEALAYFEYGTSNGQPPRPVRASAAKSAEGAVLGIVQGIIDGEVGTE